MRKKDRDSAFWEPQRDRKASLGCDGLKRYRKKQLFLQGGRCAICGTTKPGSKLGWHVDHDRAISPTFAKDAKPHSLRGVLCHPCNVCLVATYEGDPKRYGPLMPAVKAYVDNWIWEIKLVESGGEGMRPLAA